MYFTLAITSIVEDSAVQTPIQHCGHYYVNILPSYKTYCINICTVVYYVSVTQGQTRSSSFRTCAVSAFTAHRLISLMQSKHVINGPSQPPLFVVRQTLKSNVSTKGERKSPGTGEVLMQGILATLKILLFCLFFWRNIKL